MPNLRIVAGGVVITAGLLDTPTAQAVFAAAPFESTIRTWGEEVYFDTPVEVPLEPEARAIVEPGELAFWVQGHCIAIGYGRTPISHAGETRLAAPTNIWGVTRDDVRQLRSVKRGDKVLVERV